MWPIFSVLLNLPFTSCRKFLLFVFFFCINWRGILQPVLTPNRLHTLAKEYEARSDTLHFISFAAQEFKKKKKSVSVFLDFGASTSLKVNKSLLAAAKIPLGSSSRSKIEIYMVLKKANVCSPIYCLPCFRERELACHIQMWHRQQRRRAGI